MIEDRVTAFLVELERLDIETKDPYWARAAKQHFLNGLHAYKRALLDAPKAPATEDLF